MRITAVANTTPTYPQVRLELPDIATDSAAVVAAPGLGFKDSIAHNAYEQAGLGPEDLSCAEVYDLSTALELDWYENLGLCAEGEGAKLVRNGETALGGRVPVNASGGLSSFGEAIPAQAIAQVCELTRQLQGRCERPPGRGRHRRSGHQPGPVRARLLHHRHHLTTAIPSSTTPTSSPVSRSRYTTWPRPTSSTQSAPPWADAAAGCPPSTPPTSAPPASRR